MGRVSKYKKVKSVDFFGGDNTTPFGAVWGFGDNGRKSKKRSATAKALRKRKLKRKREKGVVANDDGFDLPLEGSNDFELSDLRIKKQKLTSEGERLVERHHEKTTEGLRCVIPKTEKEEAKVARMLNIEEQPKSKNANLKGRMEGESKNAFDRRVKSETRQIIKREAKESHSSTKRQRKKDFLNSKKKKKKRTYENYELDSSTGDARDSEVVEKVPFVTGEKAAAAATEVVAFGEQAKRPPVLQQLLRGARKKTANVANKKKSVAMNDAQIEAEHEAMESMRRKVQAQYRLIKAKRKQAGDFHL